MNSMRSSDFVFHLLVPMASSSSDANLPMASSSSDAYLLWLDEQIRQTLEQKRQKNKNNDNNEGGCDYVLPYLLELRAIWINNQPARGR